MSIRTFFGILVLLAGVVLVGCTNSNPSTPRKGPPTPEVKDYSVEPSIIAGTAKGALLDPIVVRDCLLTVKQREDVPTQRDGVLVTILVKEGDEVKAGQLLAQM